MGRAEAAKDDNVARILGATMTAAAITCNSIPAPMLVVTAPSQPVCTIPAIPAESAEIM